MQAATELVAIMSTIDPATSASAVLTGDQIDMADFHEALFIMCIGAVTSTATVALDIYGGAASGTPSAVITGKQSTTLTGTAASLLQVEIRVTADEAAAQGYRYLWPYVTVGATAGTRVALVGLGVNPRYGPADMHDLSTVTEIVT